MTFDGTYFYTSKGARMKIVATQKTGRWFFKDENNGHLYASGITPAQFAREFWFAELS